ncbi:hypothetical protein HXX76_009842 [Chlamydomonas incerta]|uniref:Uncharacterized protein n=1 Tax=Chlamydomonas incerta TaxID=51695 RepID=A0A835SPK8_CHLIN|nr:hypothetical protein HXX76_009842 [Chlamydomonas incerta]|eukprot:KAG2430868.1 hypothetical protein HXX76_009842 [Chlamydomonas incerta]
MVVGAAKEEYDKEWAEKGVTMEFDSPQSRVSSVVVDFLPQADAWVFRHGGMEFKLPREKGQREFEQMLTTLMSAVATSLEVYPVEEGDRFDDYETPYIKAVLTRNGKKVTQLVVCKGDNVGPDEMVRHLRILWYMQ